eukprot:scaffold263418_cov28-Attheya_sp.AAC.1
MAEPTALRLHDNQSFPDQLGYAVHQTAVQTMAHLKKDTVLKGDPDMYLGAKLRPVILPNGVNSWSLSPSK